MRLVRVFGVVGQLLRYFSAAFTAPLLHALVVGESQAAIAFAFALGLTFIVGTLLAPDGPAAPTFARSEALAVVALTWLFTAVVAAIPYLFEGLTVVDALFESMSGLTTTGATILLSFEGHSRSLFLWRAMSQWFGGVGVIALFVVVLPRLGIAGRQLFFAESSTGPSEAISPRIRDSATRLWALYSGLTVVLVALLYLAGLSAYDALVHALTTLSAGGFSPDPSSVAGFSNPTVEWILVVFMLLAGTSFTLQYRVLAGRGRTWPSDAEFGLYLGVAVAGALGVAFVLAGGIPDLDDLRQAAFQSASLISSTGFASTDYNLWPDSARVLLLCVMLIGGCAGSAAGGPKVNRWLMVFKRARAEITLVRHPRAVLPVKYGGKVVADSVMRAVFTLVVLYVVGYVVSGLILVMLGADLVTGFTAALACLGNIGPGLGPAGPMGSYGHFSDGAKLLLTFDMWIGRLEIVSVLALLHPDVWANLRLRD